MRKVEGQGRAEHVIKYEKNEEKEESKPRNKEDREEMNVEEKIRFKMERKESCWKKRSMKGERRQNSSLEEEGVEIE